ncbi:apolipoprotein N-acyltransferase [bacterium]|nr:apolipoprotein N-acyltransferase [bacterium]
MSRISIRAAATAVLASALLHALAMPPWGWWPLAFVALAPLLALIERVTPLQAAGWGLAWGMAAHWAEAAWVLPAMSYYYDQPMWFAVAFGVVSSFLYRGLHYAAFAATACWLIRTRSGAARVLLLAVTWTAFELLRARGPTADPWLLLGYALVPAPMLLQAADLGGIYLLSFVLALVNAAVATLVGGNGRIASVAVATAAGTCLVAYGAWRISPPPPAGVPVSVAVVQGNNDVGAQWRAEYYGAGLPTYLSLSREVAARARPRLLIWPESAVTSFLANEPRHLGAIEALLSDLGATLVTGAPHVEDPDPAVPIFYNSAFAITADGIQARADKERLLPFAEYFPFRFIAFLRRRFGRVRTFAFGDTQGILPTPLGPTAVVICFEGVFPELVRARMGEGAAALINLSNDGWLGRGSGPAQHFAMVVPRAVEERTWLIRATTTGVSALVDPNGVVHQPTPLFATAAITGEVAPTVGGSPYRRWGDWFAWSCALALALAAAARVRPRRVLPASARSGES